jgi:hypothetical protein
MEKIKVSQDFLYEYLKEHNFVLANLCKFMGVSESIVSACFRHDINRHGKPLSFSKANIVKLNDALPLVANEIRCCMLTFGTGETRPGQKGKVYDPALVVSIRDGVGKYFKLRPMLYRLLGWNVAKCRTTLSIEKSPVYGNVTREDADRINVELLAVAGVLSNYEVVNNIDSIEA